MWHVSPMTHCNIIAYCLRVSLLNLASCKDFVHLVKLFSRKGHFLFNPLVVVLPFMSQGLYLV